MKLLSAIFREEISDYTYPFPKQSFLRIFALLIVSGAMVWVLALAFDKLMIGPVFCSNVDNVSICANSTIIASYVALVLTGILLVPLLAVFGVKRPLLVVVAATISLWGITLWANGSWILSMLWVLAATVLVYLALIWLNRIRGNAAAILFMALFVILARVVLAL